MDRLPGDPVAVLDGRANTESTEALREPERQRAGAQRPPTDEAIRFGRTPTGDPRTDDDAGMVERTPPDADAGTDTDADPDSGDGGGADARAGATPVYARAGTDADAVGANEAAGSGCVLAHGARPPRWPGDWRVDTSALRLCEYLVFGGGGAKGVAHCAALVTLVAICAEEGHGDLLARIKGAGGTSIGATLALAAVCRADLARLERFVRDPAVWDPGRLLLAIDPVRFLMSERGFCGHEVLYPNIDRLMSLLDLPPGITFAGLHALTGKDFVCNACDVVDDRVLMMSHRTTPRLAIRDALCMTMCVACVVRPFRYAGRDWCDGGTFQNYIGGVFPASTTIGVVIAESDRPIVYALPPPPSKTGGAPGSGSGSRCGPVPTAAPTSADSGPCGEGRHPQSCGSPATSSAIGAHADALLGGRNGLAWVATVMSALCRRVQAAQMAALSEEHRRALVRIHAPDFPDVCLGASPVQISLLWEYGRLSVVWHFVRERYVPWLLRVYVQELLDAFARRKGEGGGRSSGRETEASREGVATGGSISFPTDAAREAGGRTDTEPDGRDHVRGAGPVPPRAGAIVLAAPRPLGGGRSRDTRSDPFGARPRRSSDDDEDSVPHVWQPPSLWMRSERTPRAPDVGARRSRFP